MTEQDSAAAKTTRSLGAAGLESVVPPHVLREYALLADGERGAVVGPRGDIAWMCVPRWDSDAIFTGLVGGLGGYTVTPDTRYVWGGNYEESSMIWCNRWTTGEGIIECRDALVYPSEPHRAVLLRQVKAVDAPATVMVTLRPRGGYDREPLRELRRHGGIWTGRVGRLHLRWIGAEAAHTRLHGKQLILALTLRPGHKHDLVLEISDEPLPDQPADADACWRATEAGWAKDVPTLDNSLAPRDSRRSYAVLRGLTSAGGGMVAAATTSLPERAEAGRNYDYRYVWIRDQCYAGIAVAAAESFPLLDAAVSFVASRLLEHGDAMAPAYTTTGAPVPDQHHVGLPGYPGGFDLIGNWVNTAISARRVWRGPASVRRGSRSRPPRDRTLESGRGRRHRDRPPMERARRRDLGDRTPSMDAQPAHRRQWTACHRRRTPGPPPDRRLDLISRPHHRRHLCPRTKRRWTLATSPRRPRPRCRATAARPAGRHSGR